jgi:hypothetical protein
MSTSTTAKTKAATSITLTLVRCSISPEFSEDESSDSDVSFGDLGDVPYNSSQAFPKPLGGVGEASHPRRLPIAGSLSRPSEWRRREDATRQVVVSWLQRIEVHRVSDHLAPLVDDRDECGVQAALNQMLAVLEDDDWANGGVIDHETDGKMVDGKHDGQRDPNAVDPNAVHAVPSTPPAKPRGSPPPVEAPDAAPSPVRYLPARELRAREANCALPPDTPQDDNAARARAILRKRGNESSARSSVISVILTLRATHGEDDAAPPMHNSKVLTVHAVCEDDADALKTRSWPSLFHDGVLLCGGGGGVGGIGELDVDGAVEGGMCCACGFMEPTTASDAAPVVKVFEEGTAIDTAAMATPPCHFDEHTMVRMLG